MRKILSCLLILFMVLGGIVISTDQVSADDKGKGKDGKIPYGIAKKFMVHGLENLFQVRAISRAQAAYLIAEKTDDEYKDFKDSDEYKNILAKVSDYKAIPSKYKKAVAFVINEELMPYTTLPNGKILFQPNKTVTWNELAWILNLNKTEGTETTTVSKGTVRLVEQIGSNTWIVIASADGLRSAYFPAGQVPSGLVTGIYIEVNLIGSKITSSSLSLNQNQIMSSLVLSVKTVPTLPKSGETVTLVPSLINTSQSAISLQNTQYRFTLKKYDSSSEWEFYGNTAQDLAVPANNSGSPLSLAPVTSLWTPPSFGEYRIVKAQLRINNGEWKDIKYMLNEGGVNLLTVNQSTVETDTAGFASFGQDIYVGAALSRFTGEKWQGSSSLKIETNGYNSWQGVNLNYKGTALSGPITFSFYVKATEGTPIKVKAYDNTNGNYPAGAALEFTAGGTWERKTMYFTPQQATGDLYLQIYLNNSSAATIFYIDGMQLERGTQATSWGIGGIAFNNIYVNE